LTGRLTVFDGETVVLDALSPDSWIAIASAGQSSVWGMCPAKSDLYAFLDKYAFQLSCSGDWCRSTQQLGNAWFPRVAMREALARRWTQCARYWVTGRGRITSTGWPPDFGLTAPWLTQESEQSAESWLEGARRTARPEDGRGMAVGLASWLIAL